MEETIWTAQGERVEAVPRRSWAAGLAAVAGQVAAGLAFMGEEHHRVRNFAVRELPRVGAPLTPALIAAALDLPRERVETILDDLERHMTFLFRNGEGAVSWAYPVTVEATPHRIAFESGERLYAA